MPNLMIDALKTFGSSTSIGTSVAEMVSDAKSIKETLMGGAKNAKETYRNMRQNGFRKVTDWFFQRGDEFGMNSALDDDSDDFDAGFNYGSDDDSDSSQVLDYEGMKGIAKGQVSAMYNIAGKQAEATAMTASEVISNLNDRSSEILSSLGTINSSLETISQKLDKLVVVTAAQSNERESSMLDSSGNLTLGSVFGGLKGAFAKTEIGQLFDLGKTLLGSAGQMTPGQLIGTIGNMAIADRQFKALNDQSINQISDSLNEKFLNFQNEAFTKLFNSDAFKKIFGDKTRMSGSRDYGAYITNQYTKDKAVFDGITRKTIVDIIPSYLRKITEALTGTTYHISEYGTLTTERAEGFQQVARSVIADGFKSGQISKMAADHAGAGINEDDLRLAQRILVGLYVGIALDEENAISTSDMLKNGGNPDVNAEAAQILGRCSNKSTSYWMGVISIVNATLDSDKSARVSFIRTINQTVANTHNTGVEYASSATFIDDIGEISHEMIVGALEENIKNVYASGGDTRTYDDLIRAKEITEADLPPGAKRSDRVSDEAIRQAKLRRARQSDIITNPQANVRSAVASSIDYLASIFEILNRGVNVYPVKQKKKFKPIELKHVTPETPTVINTPPAPEVDTSPQPEQQQDESDKSEIVNGGGDQSGQNSQGDQGQQQQQGDQQQGQNNQQQQNTDPNAGLKNATNGILNVITNPTSIFGKVKSAISNEIGNMKEDAIAFKDSALDSAAGWADKHGMLQRDVDNLDDANDDKQKAQEILAAMQTAAQDGDTQEDIAAISAQISEIKDPKLKSRLERMVSTTLKRSDTKKPAKSKIGKILLWGFGIAKKFLGGVFGKAKTFITKFGKGILKPILDNLKSAGKKITTGAKAVKEGFIGSRAKYRKAKNGEPADEDGYAIDENGNRIVERERTTGLVQDSIAWGKEKINKIRNSETVGNLKTAASNIKEIAKDKISNAAGKVKDWWNQPSFMKELASSFGQSAKNGLINVAGTVGGKALIAKDKIQDKVGDLKERFANTNFGKGFLEAWQDPKEEERKKNPEPKTAADVATKTVAEMLKNVDGKGEGGAETAISSIIKFLKETRDNIVKKLAGEEAKEDEEKSEVVEEGEKGSENESEKSDNDNGTSTVETGGGESSAGGETASAPEAAPAGDAGGGDAGGGAAPAAGGGAQAGGGGGIGAKLKGMLGGGNAGGMGFDIGKMLGGMTKILAGIAQAVLSVIMGMEGFKAIMNLGMDILKKSLKPLNKAFQAIYKALKPIVKTITRLLKEIVGYVVEIVQSVMKFIQPILEAIEPIIESLLETLMPILELVTGLVNVLLIPLMAIMKVAIVPTLKIIGNTLEILLGIVQVGMGIILTALGGILIAVGSIVKFLTGSGGIKDTGKQLFDTGKNMVKSGSQSIVSGMKKSIALVGETIDDVMGKNDKEEETAKKKKKKNTELHGSALEGVYGNGDESLDETFGGAGASQRKYGTYLNMAKRGCGPVAIADAYARRTGNNVDAAQLASVMNSSGTYSQNAGTSVRGYINTSRALGMNLTPGSVTATSLRHASPNNPITIVGSGPSFTTRNGNNHYMNVVGSDSHGTAYVSNPMTGRIERKNINSLASSSVLGLYGSGDANAPYAMSDDVQEAIGELKAIVKSIIDIFTGDSSVEAALAKEEENQNYEQKQYEAADLTEDEQAEVDKRARELFEKEHGRYEGETDAQFEKRYEKYKKKYWAMAAAEKVKEKVKASADGSDGGAMSLVKDAIGEDGESGMFSSFAESMYAVDDSVEAGGLAKLLESDGDREKKEKGAPRYESDNGAILWTDQYTPEIRKNKGSMWSRGAKQSDYQLILDEYFRNTISPNIKITGAFKRYLDPVDDDMVGTRGEEHAGADFTIGGNPEIHATTGGRVVEVVEGNDHFGNYVKIQDSGGDYHIYAHLNDIKVQKGDEIEGGDVIGTMGHTGSSQVILKQGDSSHGDTSLMQSGDRLHYEIRNEDNEILNPFTFFKYKRGGGRNGSVTLDPQEAMIRAASEVFVKAAEASSDPGHLYHNVTSAKNITFDDGFVIDKIAPTHCTSMMGAVVKRMGYYTYPGSGYTETYQGEDYMGGDVAKKWGVSGSVGKAKIYNRDGSVSDDWETGPVSNWQPGDIMFTSTGNAHAHMPVFKSTNGTILGFNGGADDSSKNSIALGKYYLENGKLPEDVAYNDTGKPNIDKDGCHDHNISDQLGAIAGPLKYYIRYVGEPVTFSGDDDEDWEDDDFDYYDDDIYFDDGDLGENAQAGVNAANSAKASQDAGNHVPYYWPANLLKNGKRSSTDGVIKNKAGTQLAKWHKFLPNTPYTVIKEFTKAHSDGFWYKATLAGLGEVWVYDFNSYTSGQKAYDWMKGTMDEINSYQNEQSSSAVVTPEPKPSQDTTLMSQMKKMGLSVWTSNGVPYYEGWQDPKYFFKLFNRRKWLNTWYTDRNYPKAPTWSDSTIWNKFSGVNGDLAGQKNAVKIWRNSYAWNLGYSGSMSDMRERSDLAAQLRKKGYDIPSYSSSINRLYDYTIGKVSGSGDESSIIPGIDIGTALADQIDAIANTGDQSTTAPIIVNQYSAQQTVDDSNPINAILTNTYNVRSEKIESILEDMLALMREKNQRKRNKQSGLNGLSNPSTSAGDFSTDDIPHSVERLSVG